MIDWLSKVIKYEPDNNKVDESKEEQLTTENKSHHIRKKERIHYIDDDYSKICTKFYEFSQLWFKQIIYSKGSLFI
jgi:hypothetical protein